MELTPEVTDRIAKLFAKYSPLGQDALAYLDGLLHSSQLTYWDYLHIDTLLTLQTPRTAFPDENIFIIYHQITELYFKLILLELQQVLARPFERAFWLERLHRVQLYFHNLTHSFSVMQTGMDPAQFLQFRMALLPASGFQSAQFRIIEFHLTGLSNLMNAETRRTYPNGWASPAEAYPHLYWKYGNRDQTTGEKTLTLKMFEAKYDGVFLETCQRLAGATLNDVFEAQPEAVRADPALVEALRNLDRTANLEWRKAHLGAARAYLEKTANTPVTATSLRTEAGSEDTIQASGGTNWRQYLRPGIQQIVYFPSVWTADELAAWG
jgi:tryptophan 2,3-dioxygenase